MKELLMKDANELYLSPSKRQEYGRKIEKAEYDRFYLNEFQFNNLVFMEANDTVWDKNQELVDTLTPNGEPRTLRAVTDRILQAYPHSQPIKIFKHLSEHEPWFDGCFILSARFDYRLLGELKVRPLTVWGKRHSSPGSFYLEDGNHRALVYAVFLRLEASNEYNPVRAIWSSDWEHIFPWAKILKNSQMG